MSLIMAGGITETNIGMKERAVEQRARGATTHRAEATRLQRDIRVAMEIGKGRCMGNACGPSGYLEPALHQLNRGRACTRSGAQTKQVLTHRQRSAMYRRRVHTYFAHISALSPSWSATHRPRYTHLQLGRTLRRYCITIMGQRCSA